MLPVIDWNVGIARLMAPTPRKLNAIIGQSIHSIFHETLTGV